MKRRFEVLRDILLEAHSCADGMCLYGTAECVDLP